MPQLKAINWYEGMLLTAQHFRQNDWRFQQMLNHRLSLVFPFNYGVLALKHEAALLSEGILRILVLDAIMPNGEIISYTASDINAKPLEMNFKDINSKGSLTIRCGTPQVTLVSQESDEAINAHDPQDVIPTVSPNLILYAQDTPKAGMSDLPIFNVSLSSGIPRLEEFVPPCFSFDAYSIIRDKIVLMLSKTRELSTKLSAQYKLNAGSHSQELTGQLLAPLYKVLPILSLIERQDCDHPYEWYKRLTHIVAELMPLNLFNKCPDLPKYKHDQLLSVFDAFVQAISNLLNAIKDDYKLVPFHCKETVFSRFIDLDDKAKKILIGIKFKSRIAMEDRQKWVKNAIIASAQNFEAVLKQRVIGAHRSILEAREFPTGLYCTQDIVITCTVDDVHLHHTGQVIVFNPMDTFETLPTAVYLCTLEANV